jgi:protein-tyrosine phosphatase
MEPKFIELHPRLFMRGHTKGLYFGDVLRMCQERKIRMIINVAIIPDEALENMAHNIGFKYRHIPMSDSKENPIKTDIVENLALEVATCMHQYGVLIHCDSGYNRSALVALRALTMHTGREPHVLIEEARLLRPKILKNSRFERYVLSQGAQW